HGRGAVGPPGRVLVLGFLFTVVGTRLACECETNANAYEADTWCLRHDFRGARQQAHTSPPEGWHIENVFFSSNCAECRGRVFLITAVFALGPLRGKTPRKRVCFSTFGALKSDVFPLVSCVGRLMLVEDDARIVPRGKCFILL
ncbi:unnamed protein product, partial [Ectocarpus fasciculatus]